MTPNPCTMTNENETSLIGATDLEPIKDAPWELALNVQPFLFGEGWIAVKDGDPSCRAIFDRHYSRYVYADGRKPKLFVGPGEKLVLLTKDADALCVWRKFISGDDQTGINCAIYRNESPAKASELMLQAMDIAWSRWPGERLYTYVNPRKVKPTMERGKPVWGWCFYKAGWKYFGLTKSGLHILFTIPTTSKIEARQVEGGPMR